MPLLLVYADYCHVMSGKKDFLSAENDTKCTFCQCTTCAISCMTA